MSFSTAASMPINRSLTLLVAVALALGMLVPLAAPAPADAVSTDIVISQFRTRGPAGASDEFVELHNRSSAAVDVGGLLLRRSNNMGTPNTQVTFPEPMSIGSGCFLLIVNSTAYTGATAGDFSYSTGIPDDGGLAVVTAGGTVVDAVGMRARPSRP